MTRVILGDVTPEVVTEGDGHDETSEDDETENAEARGRGSDETSSHQILYFDLETQRSANEVGEWHNCHLMRMAVGCVWDSRTGTFRDYGEAEVDRLVADLAAADLVVGFNVRRFDYRVLGGYTPRDFASVATFDMLDAVKDTLGYRLSLGHLGATTLGRPKTADGLQSLQWFKEGRLSLIIEYCRADVALTRDLFLHGCQQGYLLYERKEAGVVRLPVNWNLDSIVEAAAAARVAAPAGPARRRFGRRRRS